MRIVPYMPLLNTITTKPAWYWTAVASSCTVIMRSPSPATQTTVRSGWVMAAATAFGKTVAAIALIARVGRSSLILVHTQALLVQWKQALIMMVAATLGGYLGARVARKIPPNWLRGGIVVTGLVMAILFFLKG